MERFGSWKVESKIRDTPYGELVQVSHEARDEKATLLACHLDDQQLRSRFLLWGDALAQLEHEAIASVVESGLALGGVPFCVVDGDRTSTLGSILDEEPPDRVLALRILSSVADAIAEAHRQDVIHGMLGAGTILVEGDRIRVVDLGLWSIVLEPSGLAPKALREESAPYLAPEQVAGRRIDRQADVFAFGVLACELLGGQHPYRSGTTGETLRAILQNPIPRLEAPPWSLPSPMAALVTRCMRKEKSERIASFEPIQRALRQFLDPFVVVVEQIAEIAKLDETEVFDDLEEALPTPSVAPIPPTRPPSPPPIESPLPGRAPSSTPPVKSTPSETPQPAPAEEQRAPMKPAVGASLSSQGPLGAVTQPIRPIAGGWNSIGGDSRDQKAEPSSFADAPPPAEKAEESFQAEESGVGEVAREKESEARKETPTESPESMPSPEVDEVSPPEPAIEEQVEPPLVPSVETSLEVPEASESSGLPVEMEEPFPAPPAEESLRSEETTDEPALPPVEMPLEEMLPEEETLTADAAVSRKWIWGLVAVVAMVVVAVVGSRQRDADQPETVVQEGSGHSAEELVVGRRLQAAGVALEQGDYPRALDAVLMVLENEPDREEAIGMLGRVVEGSLRDTESARSEAESARASEWVPVIVTQGQEKSDQAQALLDEGEWEAGVRELESAAEMYRLAAKQAALFAKPVEGKDAVRERALLLAAEGDEADSMVKLLESGDGIWGEAERKALHLAVTLEHAGVVRALLEGLPEEPDLDLLLLDASFHGKPELVGVLLDLGANLEARDPLGRTPLLQAASDGHPMTTGVLLEHGADLQARDDLGRSAKELAQKGGHPRVVEVLESFRGD